MTDEITQHLLGLLVALFIAGGAAALFWKKGFYSKKIEGYKQHVTLMAMLIAFFLYFALQLFLFPLLLKLWLSHAELSSYLTSDEAGAVNLGIIYITAFVIILFATFASKSTRTAVWNPKHVDSKAMLHSFFVGTLTWVQTFPLVLVIGQLMTLYLIFSLGEAPPEQDQEMIRFLKKFQHQPEILYPLAFAIAFIIPIMEEILFRGFLQNFFTKIFGKIAAILCTSLFFAALHFTPSQGVTNFLLLPSLFLLSCFLGYLYERQGTLWAPIGLHMTFNSLTLLFLLVSLHWV